MIHRPLIQLVAWCSLLSSSCLNAIAGDDATWVEWDSSSDHVVSQTTDKSSAYPRCKVLSNGEVLLSYHHGDALGHFGSRITLRKSRDGGKNWYSTIEVDGPEANDFWGFTNPDFVELGKGTVLLASSARGKAEPGQPIFASECKRSELRLRFSDDFGASWGPPISVARGRGRLWEPSLVKLPNKGIEIYYANEAPELANGSNLGQRIELIRSVDNGKTWSDPVIVSHHQGKRNGMPSAVVLKNGRVAVAEEIVGDSKSPWIAYTLNGSPIKKDEYAAQQSYGFGGAPFLLTTTQGNTLVAYHSSHEKQRAPNGAKVPWMFATIWVQNGNFDAKSFGRASRPWPDRDPRTGAFYPSLMMKDENTVVALASFITQELDGSDRTVVRWIEGRLKTANTKQQGKKRP